MKNSINFMLSALFTTFIIVTVITVMNAYSVISYANNYHNACVAELEDSNFSQAVIDKYNNMDDSKGVDVTIENKTIANTQSGSESSNNKIYKITTNYKINPIVGFTQDKVITSYAQTN